MFLGYHYVDAHLAACDLAAMIVTVFRDPCRVYCRVFQLVDPIFLPSRLILSAFNLQKWMFAAEDCRVAIRLHACMSLNSIAKSIDARETNTSF